MNRVLTRRLRDSLLFVATLVSSLFYAGVAAAAPIAQQTGANPGPLAPPIVFVLLLLALFGAVLVFSYMSYRNAQR